MSTRGRRVMTMVIAAAAVLLVGAQFVPVDRTNPPVRNDVGAPTEVAAVLRAACYDCHSHETRWPWYSRVAPMSWFIANHVKEGRHELDFSDWPVIDFKAQDELLHEVAEEIEKDGMPLASYRWGHPEARLSAAQKDLLMRWARGASGTNP